MSNGATTITLTNETDQDAEWQVTTGPGPDDPTQVAFAEGELGPGQSTQVADVHLPQLVTFTVGSTPVSAMMPRGNTTATLEPNPSPPPPYTITFS